MKRNLPLDFLLLFHVWQFSNDKLYLTLENLTLLETVTTTNVKIWKLKFSKSSLSEYRNYIRTLRMSINSSQFISMSDWNKFLT